MNIIKVNDNIFVNIKDSVVTVAGNEPFSKALDIATLVEDYKKNGLFVKCYTGYTYEYILKNLKNPGFVSLIINTDVLIQNDGKQIDVQASIDLNKEVIYEKN